MSAVFDGVCPPRRVLDAALSLGWLGAAVCSPTPAQFPGAASPCPPASIPMHFRALNCTVLGQALVLVLIFFTKSYTLARTDFSQGVGFFLPRAT